MAFDLEDLADQSGLGSKFYVIGYSMGGHTIWSCLKHIPHRLAGATLLAPVTNYWWPCFPSNLSRNAYTQQFVKDQLSLGVAHYLPWLTYWRNTQKWFPYSTLAARDFSSVSLPDAEIIKMPINQDLLVVVPQVRQQGEYESIHQDLNIGYGSWEFDPMDIKNPFPNNEGSVPYGKVTTTVSFPFLCKGILLNSFRGFSITRSTILVTCLYSRKG